MSKILDMLVRNKNLLEPKRKIIMANNPVLRALSSFLPSSDSDPANHEELIVKILMARLTKASMVPFLNDMPQLINTITLRKHLNESELKNLLSSFAAFAEKAAALCYIQGYDAIDAVDLLMKSQNVYYQFKPDPNLKKSDLVEKTISSYDVFKATYTVLCATSEVDADFVTKVLGFNEGDSIAIINRMFTLHPIRQIDLTCGVVFLKPIQYDANGQDVLDVMRFIQALLSPAARNKYFVDMDMIPTLQAEFRRYAMYYKLSNGSGQLKITAVSNNNVLKSVFDSMASIVSELNDFSKSTLVTASDIIKSFSKLDIRMDESERVDRLRAGLGMKPDHQHEDAYDKSRLLIPAIRMTR